MAQMDPMEFMETRDQVKIMTMAAIAKKAREFRAKESSL